MVSQAVGANIAKSVTTSDDQTDLQQALFLVKLLRSGGERRFQYDDMFGSHPENINSSKSITETSTTITTSSPVSESVTENATGLSISSTLVHHQESNFFNHTQTTEHDSSSSPIIAEPAPSTSTKITSLSLHNITQDIKKLNHLLIPEKSSPPCQMQPIFNPEISQAAVELEKELSSGFQSKNSASKMRSTAWRTSIRVHLAVPKNMHKDNYHIHLVILRWSLQAMTAWRAQGGVPNVAEGGGRRASVK
ncbi:unnamed protein product, partial [Brenthis ino]